MMKCILCFESDVGVRPNDYFVATKNGHVFHHCCVLEYLAGESYQCPICDEDLRSQCFVKLNSAGSPAPCRPPMPGSSRSKVRELSRSPTPKPKGIANASWKTDSLPPPTSATAPPSPLPTSALFPTSFAARPDYVFKIVVLGDLNVGKSSLLQRYADDKFDSNLKTTVGCDLRVKAISMAGKIIRLNLWDTAGQEKHRAVVDLYLRNADGIIFCFDVTNIASFNALHDWYQFSQRCLSSDTLKIIVGTKSDLWSHRVVRSHQIKGLAALWNAQYIFTSAKDAINVEIVFRSLAALILEQRLPSAFSEASLVPSATLPLPPPAGWQDNLNSRETINLYKPLKNRKKKKNCC